MPGRVRLRFETADAGAARSLAARVPGHPAVRATWWVESIRSLTVAFDPARDIGDILAEAVTSQPLHPTEALAPRAGLDWGRVVVSCLLALLPLGPLGSVAVAAIGAIVEQRRERAGGWPRARPTEAVPAFDKT
ncbi:MAG TPA: hypothetical protein VGO86_05205 [Candidatus Dormibacteraeota bacterium]